MYHDHGKEVAIVGAGLVGCLLGVYLRKHQFSVSIFESRSDPRLQADQGRSINLVITSRGIAALTGVSDELAEKVMAITVPVFGRSMHSETKEVQYQPYGPTASHCNFSVSRWELNTVLMSAAEDAGCKLFFNHPLQHVDAEKGILYFYLQNPTTTQLYQKALRFGHIFGTDGGGSRCRQALKGLLQDKMEDRAQPLRYGYKELTMPKPPASSSMELDTLAIWPRGSHFLMALPNRDGSQTMTLYMPERGDISFESINSEQEVRAYFERYYPDAIPLMPNFVEDFLENPTGFLGTVFCGPWMYKDRLLLLGDASHAITPFFGQGCNSGFEDVFVLDQILSKTRDLKRVFAAFYEARKPNDDAIANMALENFTEMMDKTGDEKFLLEKAIEIELSQRFPSVYASRYVLVTHSLVPYDLCLKMGVLQQKVLSELSSRISNVQEVDYALAKKLIDRHIVPFLRKHKISASDFNYSSKYYPNARLRSKL